jgi:hypothetical protein
MESHKTANSLVRTIYMYLVCIIAIITFIFGSISAVNITLKYFVFDLKTSAYEQSPEILCNQAYQYPSKAVNTNGQLEQPLTEEEIAECITTTTASQLAQGKKSALETLSWALAALLISFPIWAYHWRFIKK